MSNYIWLVKNRHVIAHMAKKGGKSTVLEYFCEVSKGDVFVEGRFFMHTSGNYFFPFCCFYLKSCQMGMVL